MFDSTIFVIIFFKIISGFLSILIGFLAGKLHNVQRDSIASLLFYFIGPIVFGSAPMNLSLSISTIGITLVVFGILSTLGIFNYYWLGKIWKDSHRNVLALSSTTTNCGYFMLPIVTSIFNEQILSIYMLCIIGAGLAESSIGFFLCARSLSSVKSTLLRVLKLPMFNAFLLGCFFSSIGIKIPDFLNDFMHNMRSAYSILGMTMVGLGLSSITKFEIDPKFTIAALIINFVVQPLGFCVFIALDIFVFKTYDINYYKCLFLISICPISANVIIVSSMINFSVQKIAPVVFISIIIELMLIPSVLSTGVF